MNGVHGQVHRLGLGWQRGGRRSAAELANGRLGWVEKQLAEDERSKWRWLLAEAHWGRAGAPSIGTGHCAWMNIRWETCMEKLARRAGRGARSKGLMGMGRQGATGLGSGARGAHVLVCMHPRHFAAQHGWKREPKNQKIWTAKRWRARHSSLNPRTHPGQPRRWRRRRRTQGWQRRQPGRP